ncbi:ATP-dependent helicase [Bosea sp. F3-2]|nr:ATP-dependent helicase [Bosea sp. F3-2]
MGRSKVAPAVGWIEAGRECWRTCLAIHSRCVNAELPIEEVLGRSYSWCVAWAAELKELFAADVEAKRRQNVLDYDDLLLYWAQAMTDPDIAADVGSRFDHVMADEYQDTGRQPINRKRPRWVVVSGHLPGRLPAGCGERCVRC